MTDVTSRVGVEFTATGDTQVLRSLNEVSSAGTKTEASLKAAAEAEKRLAEEARKAAAQVKALQGAGLGLGRQFADVGVSLAGGINPLMVLIQQGPQVADAFAVAKAQGLGFSQVMKGLVASIAPLLPLLGAAAAAAAVVGGAYFAWKKQTDDLAASMKAAAKVAENFNEVQNATRSALSSAIDFAEKYKVSNVGLTQALDGVLSSQNAAYKETLAGISANDQAGQAAVRRAELERLLTVSILRRAAAEAEARGKEADAEAKKARKVASREGLFASVGEAYRGAEGGFTVDPISASEQATAAKAKALNIEATERAAKTELDYAKALKASADALMGATLTIPPAKKAREGLSAADRAAAKSAREAARAEEEFNKALQTLIRTLESPAETALREARESVALLREGFDKGKLTVDQYHDAVSRLTRPVVELKDAQKAVNVEFRNTPDDLAEGVREMKKAEDAAVDLREALYDVADAVDQISYALKSGDIGSALDGLGRAIASLGGNSALSQALGQAGAVYSAGSNLAANLASIVGGNQKTASRVGGIFGAVPGAIASLFGPKPTNAGAGYSLITGALSGGKRTAETEGAAKAAGSAILAGQDALRSAGIILNDTITGLVIGTRDLTRIYTTSGRTITSAVGDVEAAAEAALRAVLESATYASAEQKALVDKALAMGKSFDEVTAIIDKYAEAQKITGNLADAIQQLTDPKAFDLSQVEKNITAQRDAAKKLADDGFITADTLATINGQLDTLRGLQLDEVLKRYAVAVEDAAQAALDAANDNAQRAAGALSDAQQNLIDAYGREADALKATSDRFRDLAANLRQFGQSLAGGQGGAGGYQFARAAFLRTSALAQGGDEKALGDFQRVSETYLQAARAAAPDARAYARDLAAVRNAVEASARVADGAASAAEQQLQALHDQVAQLVTLNESVLSVKDAIDALAVATAANAAAQQALLDLQPANAPATVSAPASAPLAVDTTALERRVEELTAEVASLRAEQAASQAQIVKTNATTADTLVRVTRDGETMQTTVAA